MITLITDKKNWDRIIYNMSNYDFYFTYDYYKMSVQSPDKFVLINFNYEEFTISLPLIIRQIKGTNYFDAISIYGYTGPIASHQNIPENILKIFHEELNNYFIENEIVSVFIRLHPCFKNENFFDGIGDIIDLNETVFIDLNIPLEEQYKDYRKGVKSDINALKRQGFEVFEDNKLVHLEEFIALYNENMLRVNADKSYFFPSEYYRDFFESGEINAKLYLVKKDEKIAAGSIIVFSKSIIQYHLSGTKTDFLKNGPVRLILDHIRLSNTNSKYDIFHLGGGLGSSTDSLFNFKAGFSKKRMMYKSWRYIVFPSLYSELTIKANVEQDSNYFPKYRSNNFYN